jgi:hypothetical protein
MIRVEALLPIVICALELSASPIVDPPAGQRDRRKKNTGCLRLPDCRAPGGGVPEVAMIAFKLFNHGIFSESAGRLPQLIESII